MSDQAGKRVSIRWNGKDVTDPAELPPEMRKLLADADGDGIPDIAQAGQGTADSRNVLEVSVVGSTVIEMDGKTFNSVDDLPPEIREAARAALAKLTPQRLGAAATPAAAPPEARSIEQPRPRPVGAPWALVVLAVLAGGLLVYLLGRR